MSATLATTSRNAARSLRPPGPGLLEACGWTLFYLFAQAGAAAACILVLLIGAFGGWPRDAETATSLLLEINLDTNFLLTGVTTLGALFIIVPAVRLRLGPAMRERLQLQPPQLRTMLLAVGAVAPLAVVSRAVYNIAAQQWQQLAANVPALEPLTRTNTLEALATQTAGVPFVVLVVALALGPALGEEIVFRGLIGPGLVRRWGAPLGILITSVLFAGVHGFPPHAVATLPLACFVHFALLRTGSLWTPIVLHFLNNALAVAMLRFPLLARLPDSPTVVTAAALYVLVVAALLGTRWEHRPRLVTALSGDGLRIGWLDAVAGSCILGFTTAFVWSVVSAT